MKRVRLWGAVVGLGVVLASCAANDRPRVPDQIIDRALRAAPGVAQPSRIVAVELALARAVREEGERAAFAAYQGAENATGVFHQDANAEAVRREPKVVWMSCDGSLAISQGRFRTAQDMVGTFATVWRRAQDRSYRWVYAMQVLDAPQPETEKEADDEVVGIVVKGVPSIQGLVADCRALPDARSTLFEDDGASGVVTSRDGTLAYRLSESGNGTQRLVGVYLADGSPTQMVDLEAPATSAQ